VDNQTATSKSGDERGDFDLGIFLNKKYHNSVLLDL
jgi:hypothetical protein